MDKEQLKKILTKAQALEKGKEISLAKEFIDINDKIDTLSEELKKKDFITTEIVKELQGDQGIQGEQGEKGDKGDQGEPGKDGTDGKDGLNGENGLNGTDGSPDTPIQIKDKLETLKDDKRLDVSAVKGLDNFTTQEKLDFAIGVLDQRTQFLINKGVKHDSTLTGNGTDASPLHAVGDGIGDMLKATYDPSNHATDIFAYADTKVASVSGTTDRITVTAGTTPVIDIAATYVGQTSITTLGTITAGVWHGTAIANANLANSTITIGSTAISLGGTSTTLAGLTSVTSTGFTGALTGNADTATKLATARTLAITGDLAWTSPSFDGSGNVTAAGTLATVNTNTGTWGSATQVGQFTVNGKGLITAAANVTVTPAVGSITGLGTGVATALAINVGSAGAFITFNGAGGTPSSLTGTNISGTAASLTAGHVTNATFTTALTVNTGTLTLTANAANTSVLTIGAGAVSVSGSNTGDQTITLTGDVTGSGTGSFAATLATVNSNVGTFGSATKSVTVTANGKGLITAISEQTVTPAVGSITGLGTGIATWLASPSSANLLAAQTDKTGTGLLVFGTSPTLTTAILGSSTATTQSPNDNSTKVATTAYVDNAVLGQNFKEAVKVATTANLVGAYLNGASGVGATFTYTATGVDTIDGVALTLGMRVLLKNQTTDFQNGIYTVTTAGAIGIAGILTRATDADQTNEWKTGDSVFVTAGTTLTSTTWAYTGVDSPTMGTDSLTFVQVAGQGSFTGGNGIAITGTSIAIDTSVTVDKTTAQTLTNKTLTTPVINGLPTGTGIATANTASTLVARDGSGNFSAGGITGTNFTDSALTSGRVTYAGTAGILQDNANMTFDGTFLNLGAGMGLEGTSGVALNSITVTKTSSTTSTSILNATLNMTAAGGAIINATVNQNASSGSLNANGMILNVNHNAAVVNAQTMSGLRLSVTNISGATTGGLAGALYSVTASGAVTGTGQAFSGTVLVSGAGGSMATALGANIGIAQSTGSITTGKGVYIFTQSVTSGSIGTFYGVHMQHSITTGTASIGTSRGISFDTWHASTNITSDNYLLYADTTVIKGPSNHNWGIYFLPDMPSYHVGKFGIGTGTSVPSARLHIIDTTEQERVGYDASNYMSTTVASTGSTTFALTGTSPVFTFSQNILVPQVFNADHAIAAVANAATVTRAFRNNVVTNNSAATLTITMSTTSATGGDMVLVQILDFSGVTQTITWVNTEDSTVTAPTTSNGSTTLPLTVGFKWNSLTSKWRCVGKA